MEYSRVNVVIPSHKEAPFEGGGKKLGNSDTAGIILQINDLQCLWPRQLVKCEKKNLSDLMI